MSEHSLTHTTAEGGRDNKEGHDKQARASHEGTHLACFRGHDSHQIQPRLKVPIRGTDLGYITLGNLAGGTLASHHRSVTLWAYTVHSPAPVMLAGGGDVASETDR